MCFIESGHFDGGILGLCGVGHRWGSGVVLASLVGAFVYARRLELSSEESGALFLLCGYALMLLGAIKMFGVRRVLMFFVGLTMLAILVAFKTLGVVTGGRR